MSDDTPTPECSIADLTTALGSGAPVVDVREPDEFAAGHVPGAVNIPLSRVADEIPTLRAHTQRVFVVCASGIRSKAGAGLLLAAGLDAVSVAGGTSAWIQSGQPAEAGSSAGQRGA